jgi:hypothetical protein
MCLFMGMSERKDLEETSLNPPAYLFQRVKKPVSSKTYGFFCGKESNCRPRGKIIDVGHPRVPELSV